MLRAPRSHSTARRFQLFIVSKPILQLLLADTTAKLKLVNTGTRVLEKTELRGLSFPFRLTQACAALAPPLSPRSPPCTASHRARAAAPTFRSPLRPPFPPPSLLLDDVYVH